MVDELALVIVPGASLLIYLVLFSSGYLLRAYAAPVVNRWLFPPSTVLVLTVAVVTLHVNRMRQVSGDLMQPLPTKLSDAWDTWLMAALNLFFFLKTLLTWMSNDYHPLLLETLVDTSLLLNDFLSLSRGIVLFNNEYLILTRVLYKDFSLAVTMMMGHAFGIRKPVVVMMVWAVTGMMVLSGALMSFDNIDHLHDWEHSYLHYWLYSLTLGYLFLPETMLGRLSVVTAQGAILGLLLHFGQQVK